MCVDRSRHLQMDLEEENENQKLWFFSLESSRAAPNPKRAFRASILFSDVHPLPSARQWPDSSTLQMTETDSLLCYPSYSRSRIREYLRRVPLKLLPFSRPPYPNVLSMYIALSGRPFTSVVMNSEEHGMCSMAFSDITNPIILSHWHCIPTRPLHRAPYRLRQRVRTGLNEWEQIFLQSSSAFPSIEKFWLRAAG